MRIYMDTCCINRPFDDHRQERVRIEAEAVSGILSRVESGEWSLVSSEVLAVEVSMNPNDLCRQTSLELLSAAPVFVRADSGVERAAEALFRAGFKRMDAAHLASAVAGRADVFLTVDYPLLRRAGRMRQTLRVRVDSPVDFILRPETDPES